MNFAAVIGLLHLAAAVPTELAERNFLGPIFENQLIDGTPCRAVTILFVRGTGKLSSLHLTFPTFQAKFWQPNLAM